MRIGVLLACFLLAGCSSPGAAPAWLGDAAGEEAGPVRATEQLLSAIWAADEAAIEKSFGSIWMDFGSCGTYAGSEIAASTVSYAREMQSDGTLEDFPRWQDAFDPAVPYVSSAEKDEFATNCSEFDLRSSDKSVWMSPADESPWFDGFYAVMRSEGGQWKVIGGD